MVKQADSNGIDFDDSSGISSEDQKEILAEIDNIVSDNRIRVTPEVFQIKPLKKGFLFPILVNVFSLLILAAGIFTLAFFFMREQTVRLEETNAVSTAEGKLLKELKKEAEEKLLEKSKEIEKIQARMQEIDKERLNLQSTMDSRIRSKEAELRTQLEAELNAERARLQKTGMTKQQIDERIAALERQKTAEYNQRLDQFRKEVEEERLKAENNLKSLQSEYNRNLQKANDERQNLLVESQKREDELRKQLDEEKTALTKEKTEAESELTRIADQKQREEIVNTQIIGFYNTVKDDLRNRQFDEATRTLDGLKSYLSEASVISVPGVQKRREVEFFVIDSLNRLVVSEISKDKVDTSNLIESANLITSLRDSVIKADQYYRGGEIEEAEKFYRHALGLIPEVDRSYKYFVTRDTNTEEERRIRLKNYIQKAETAFAQSSFTETLDNYSKALEYLPENPTVIQSMINQVRQSGFQLEFAGLQRTESQNASGPLNAANELMSKQKFNEAILAYIDVVNRFPRSTQVKAALEGIRKAVDAKNQANQSSSAQLQASLDGKLREIETLKQEQAKRDETILQLEASLQRLEEVRAQEMAERDARISEAETAIGQLETQLQEKSISSTDRTSTLEKRLDELQNQLSSKEAELQRLTKERNSLLSDKNELLMTSSTLERGLNDLRSENDTLKRNISSLEGQITALKTSADTRTVTTLPPPRTFPAPKEGLQKELDNITQIERDFTNIQKKYERYSVLEDNILAKEGNTGLLQTKLYLDEFLTYEPVENAFPGLWRRIKVYDNAFQREGEVAAFQDIIDVVDLLARVEGDNKRVSLLDEEISRSSDDLLKRELLQELKSLLQAN